jgi:hypothetical protein
MWQVDSHAGVCVQRATYTYGPLVAVCRRAGEPFGATHRRSFVEVGIGTKTCQLVESTVSAHATSEFIVLLSGQCADEPMALWSNAATPVGTTTLISSNPAIAAKSNKGSSTGDFRHSSSNHDYVGPGGWHYCELNSATVTRRDTLVHIGGI